MNEKEKSRYARQIRLSQIGEAGQQRLLDSTALIISDFDQVEDSNLQRQIVHRTQDIGELKALSAKRAIAEINPDCEVKAIDWELDDEELEKYLTESDIVLDCSDNFPTRFAINRASVKTRTPLVSGAAIRIEGQIASYIPDSDGPCYQCLYKKQFESTETCAMEGVLSPIVGVIGTMQALQAILILTGHDENVNGKLLLFDGLSMEWQKVQVPHNPNCEVCNS